MPLPKMKFKETPKTARTARASAIVDDALQRTAYDDAYAGRVLREMEALYAEADREGATAEAQILDQESRVLRRTLAALKAGG